MNDNNYDANTEPGEDNSSGGTPSNYSVWYSWTAPTNGVVYLTIPYAGFIPNVRAFRGNAVNALTFAPPMGDGGVAVSTGDQIAIRVASIYYPWGGGGTGMGGFTLGLTFQPPIPASTNDSFASRLEIATPTNFFAGSIYGATSEPGEPLPSPDATQSLWFSFSPATSGILDVTATGLQAPLYVTFYEGDSLAALVPVAPLGDPTPGYAVTGGHHYALQFASGFVPGGQVSLDTRFQSATNDMFAGSLQLYGTNVTAWGDNRLATMQAGETPPVGGSDGKTLWYSWVAPMEGRVNMSSASVFIIRYFAVYTGPDLAHLQRVAVNGQNSFRCEADTVYYLQMDSTGARAGEFTIALGTQPFPAATNDAFANARVIRGNASYGNLALTDSSITGATSEPGEPGHGAGVPCQSVWWRWQAPKNGTATFQNQGLAPGLVYSVYTGDSVTTLHKVGGGSSSVSWNAVGGVTYRIAGATGLSVHGDAAFDYGVFPAGPYTASLPVAGNVLREPSFEGTALNLTYWHSDSDVAGSVGEPGGADGSTWVELGEGNRIYQDFASVPGRQYKVNFAWSGGGQLQVKWDDQVLGVVQPVVEDQGFWNWTNYIATATSNTTRLDLTIAAGVFALDGVSVVPLNAAPAIITPPAPLSTFVGGAAAFLVGASGTEPMYYRWYFNDAPMPGQTNKTVTVDPVVLTNGGKYVVVITNTFGAVTSAPVNLNVLVPSGLAIVMQPAGGSVAPGSYCALSVAAVGSPPLHYQWSFNGQELAGATSPQYIIASAQPGHAGSYTAKVWNGAETVWSLPATLIVDTNLTGGGMLYFYNQIPDGGQPRRAWVFDIDGFTKLSGGNFVAQLYAGPTMASMRPVGVPEPFLTGFSQGLFSPANVVLPTVPPLTMAFVQVRAWDVRKGASYEAARALGGKFGKSAIFQNVAGMPDSPVELWNLQSFNLQAGLPQFVVGTITLNGQNPDGSPVWLLTGQAGYTYVIERQTLGDTVWQPMLVLANPAGTVTFSDPAPPPAGALYRARILD